MGESACLIQTSFSHATNTAHQDSSSENLAPLLTESISFGKFVSETLEWGKWSSFSHNKYLEEAEKYSRPGSVAQKKAYFEAHHKKIVAKKAAALLEQANNANQEAGDDGVQRCNLPYSGVNGSADNHFQIVDDGYMEVQSNVNDVIYKPDESLGTKESDSAETMDEVEGEKDVKTDPVIKNKVPLDSPLQIELPQRIGDVENLNKVEEVEQGRISLLEKSPSMENSFAIKKEAISSISAVSCRLSKSLPAKPATPSRSSKQNSAAPDRKKSTRSLLDKKRSTPKSLHMSINCPASSAREIAPRTTKRASPILKKGGGSTIACNSLKKSHGNSNILKTMTSSNLSINFAPSHASESTPRNVKRASHALGKCGSSKPECSPSMKSQESSNTLKTPNTASINRALKLPSATPQSENRRSKAPLERITPGGSKMERKWQSLSVDRSRSSSVCVTDTRTPIISAPFTFRSDERAAKRKEYFLKLEEKFNEKEMQKVQRPAKPKERAETELKRLCQSVGFKARPLPDFYRATESPKSSNEIPLTRPRSPRFGRKPATGVVQDKSPLPPLRPPVKKDASKHVAEKKVQPPTRAHFSSQTENSHENSSPNIQC